MSSVLIGGVATLLGTTAGSRWVLERVPGLQVEQFGGRLGGRWQAARLLWTQDGSRVEVMSPVFDWKPSCLLQLTLCVNELQTGDIDLVFPSSPDDEAASEPFSLPDIKLPVALAVGRIEIGQLRFNTTEQLQSLLLTADWQQDGIEIRTLQVRREDLQLGLHGRLQPSGAWPLQLQGEASLAGLVQRDWKVSLGIDGTLRERIDLKVDSQGYFNGRLAGRLSPLDEALPAEIRLTADSFKASPELPDTLTLKELELTAKGDLKTGYQLLGTALLPGQGGAVRLALDGLVDSKGARLDQLELDAGNKRRLLVRGKADWQQALKAQARLDWHEFPWQRLYPLAEQPPVDLRNLTAQVNYDDGNYQGNFAAALQGPAGDFTLKSPFDGTLQRLNLPQLELVAGQGKASGNVTVGFANGIDWKTRLQLSSLNPAYWVAELPGNLGGLLVSQGTLRNETLAAQIELGLNGRLRKQPTDLRLQASGEGNRWDLADLQFRFGDNRIQGKGCWAERLAGQLDLNLPRLAQVWPGLTGQVKGRLELSGTATAPQGQLNLNGQGLAFAEQRLRQMTLAASLNPGERLKLALDAKGVSSAGKDYGQLTITAEGTRERHAANLTLQGAVLDLALAVDGSLRGQDWRGRLASVNLAASGQKWALRQPTAIERLGNGRLTLAAHCWDSGPASLCAESQRLMPEPQLRYRLRNFPLASLAQFMPDDFAWKGDLNADLKLDLPKSGPNGSIRIDAGPGVLRMRERDNWLDFPYQTLSIDSQLKPHQVDTHLTFQGNALGTLQANVIIDPRGETKPLSGDFQLSGVDLATARPFVPQVDRLEGKLNGNGRLGGTLQKPQVNGQLILSNGVIAGNQLPTSLENLQVRLGIQGELLRIDGSWQSGKQGRGRIDGTLAWADALALDMTVSGQHLPIAVEPYAELDVTPTLKIGLAGERLTVTGKVEVPRGQITVRQLPPSTVSVSSDTVIVGDETKKAAPSLQVAMDIDVVVGKEKLTFSGFGLEANLAGYMHIGDNLDGRGELNLNNGRYKAYGQNLSVRRARLLFIGSLTQPYLDIEAVRTISSESVVAGLHIAGNAAQPTVTVFSEPTMAQEQALSYLITGHALGGDADDSNLVARAALGLGLAGSASITGALAQTLGFQDFELDSQGTGDATSVVASGKINDRLSLRYGFGVFEPSSTIGLRYRLTQSIFLEAVSGLASSLDLFYRKSF
nr:translocation/assembly module TamB domain-containing protein [Azomonas macrocytogenes]